MADFGLSRKFVGSAYDSTTIAGRQDPKVLLVPPLLVKFKRRNSLDCLSLSSHSVCCARWHYLRAVVHDSQVHCALSQTNHRIQSEDTSACAWSFHFVPSRSPQYMPPEQLSGGLLTPKTDVWALGVLLWELLVGRPAWVDVAKGRLSDYDLFRRLVITEGVRLPTPANAAAMAAAPLDGEVGLRRLGALLEAMMATDAKLRPTMAQVS